MSRRGLTMGQNCGKVRYAAILMRLRELGVDPSHVGSGGSTNAGPRGVLLLGGSEKWYEPPHREELRLHCDVCGNEEPWPPVGRENIPDSEWRIESHKREIFILCSNTCYVQWMLTHG